MKYHKTPVYVVSRTHKPLMPTYRFGHVRKLLEQHKAVPINNNPFTIRLKYNTPDITQELYGGGDTGCENIGMSASTENGECVYLSDIRTNNKSIKQIYCQPIGSGCLQYTGSKDTRIVVIEAERQKCCFGSKNLSGKA